MKRILICTVFLLSSCAQQKPAPFQQFDNGAGARAGEVIFGAGDNLYLIAERYGVSLRDLIEANHLRPPYTIASGTRLVMPPPRHYVVRKGDSVGGIARVYNVSRAELVRINNLRRPYDVTPGQTLRLPSRYVQADKVAPIAPPPLPQKTVLMETPSKIIEPVYPVQPPAKSLKIESTALKQSPEVKAALPTPSQAPQPLGPQDNSDFENMLAATAKKPEPISESEAKLPTPLLEKPKILVQETETPKPEKASMPSDPPPMKSAKFLWPVKGNVVSNYGAGAGGQTNDGINIAAPKGSLVRAAENGIVVYAGSQLKGFGNLILIRHDKGFVTAYAHLDSIVASKGAVVRRGETIGKVGKTGSVDRPQLHFELRKKNEPVNPKNYL